MKVIKRAAMILLFSLFCASTVCAAEEPATPKSADQQEATDDMPNPQEMQDLTMAMAPALGMMAQNMMDGIYTGLAKPDTAKKLAKFMRNYYEALVAEGFSKDDAVQIIKGFAVPSMGGK